MTAPSLTRAPVGVTTVCPPWCNGSCAEYSSPGEPDYHGSNFTDVAGIEGYDPTRKVVFNLSLTKLDATPGVDDESAGVTTVHLITGFHGDDFTLSPATARQLAAGLLNIADRAEPLPLGVAHIPAEEIRVGDEIDTPDGWQTVYQTTVDARSRFVAAFTDERADSDTDGWQYTFGDPLIARRQAAPRRRREVRR